MPAPRPLIAMLLAAVLCGALACVPVASGQAPGAPAGATLAADPGALRGHPERLRGALPDAAAGTTVQVQRLDPVRGWVAEASTTAATGGAFVALWRPRAIGRVTVRAVAGSDGARAAAVGPTTSVTVYRPARATWYGPGMYGHHTACGQVLSHRIMGVAHKTLPCGTPVEISFAGSTVTVPVIDRGPFSNGAHYDLTSAVAQQIGMTETSIIGVMPQRGATMAPPLAAPPPSAATGGAVPPGG
jgi:peptidoglycan lytic transglycosylase